MVYMSIPKTKGKAPEIVQAGHPALHTPAKEVIFSEIKSAKIQKVIADMIKALESQEDGVGLAAPQIGISLRIFIVAGFVFDRINNQANLDHDLESELDDDKVEFKPLKKSKHQIFINPIITKESKEKKWMDGEGCLSVRWLYGKVHRSTRVTLRAYNENGEIVERGASGLLAHIFQHEVDHLNGILFIEKAKDIREFDPEEIKAEAKKAKQARDNKNK